MILNDTDVFTNNNFNKFHQNTRNDFIVPNVLGYIVLFYYLNICNSFVSTFIIVLLSIEDIFNCYTATITGWPK